jgi:hypothetical protein
MFAYEPHAVMSRPAISQLIFYAIGYKGLYMDVSELGFPIKQYPSPENTE